MDIVHQTAATEQVDTRRSIDFSPSAPGDASLQGIAISTKARPPADPTVSNFTPVASHVDLVRFRADLRAAGVEDMVVSLLRTFMDDCPGRFAALEQAVQQGNPKAIESAAHAFRSGAGTIRATVLAERLGFVEESASLGRLESIAVSLEQIRSEQLAVMRELEPTQKNGA